MKNNQKVHLEQDETYKSLSQKILKIPNIQCYAKFINEKYKDKSSLYEPNYKFDWGDGCKKDDINLNNRIICYHPQCFNYILNDKKYCDIHQQKSYDI